MEPNEAKALEATVHYLAGELQRAHLIAAQLQGNLVLAQQELAEARKALVVDQEKEPNK